MRERFLADLTAGLLESGLTPAEAAVWLSDRGLTPAEAAVLVAWEVAS